MLTPDYLAHCADHLLGLYDELDRAIIADISRRIVKTGGITPTAEHQIDKAMQSGMLLSDVTKQVAQVSGISQKEVERMFNEAAIVGMQNDAKPLILNGKDVNIALSPAMRQTMEAAISKTNGDLRNLTMTMGASASGLYEQAVNNAYMKLQSGAFSYNQAIRDAIKQAAEDGNFVLYASGHRDQLDVAVRRSVLTGMNQTAGRLTELYSEDMGAEYYETSAHAGARPSHAEWQGRVFKINGSEPDYPNFEESTGYGTGAGLCGWNCRHSFYPFFPGLSKPAYSKELLDWYDAPRFSYNGDDLTEYEVSQLMRKNEREIRATKRELAGYKAAGEAATDPITKSELKNAYDQSGVKLKAQEAKYRDLCNQTNHKTDSTRTSVVATKDSSGRIVSWNQSSAQSVRRNVERLERTANERYTKGSTSENVRVLLADNRQRTTNASDKTLKTLDLGQQRKHIKGTNEYKQNTKRSYLTVSEAEAQELVNKYAGTGDIKRDRNGHYNRREVCTADRVIGVVVDQNTGQPIGDTHRFTIHYSNKGTHIVPAMED